MSARDILDRVSKYRATGKGKWIAVCPAHSDNSPSLSITELPDTRVLLHCHAGCGALDVLTAIGLSWDAAMPPEQHPQPHYRSTDRRHNSSLDDFIVELAEDAKAHGRKLTATDKERYKLALKRKGRRNGFADKVRREANKPLSGAC
jgi:hypothetical protein